MRPSARGEEQAAVATDAYLVHLLADGEEPAGGEIDPLLARAAGLVHRHLRAVRPSFGFEESLAARLAAAAGRAAREPGGAIVSLSARDPRGERPEGVGLASGGGGLASVVPLPILGRPSARLAAALLTGGLIATLVPLAGTALWVWVRRRGRWAVGPAILARRAPLAAPGGDVPGLGGRL